MKVHLWGQGRGKEIQRQRTRELGRIHQGLDWYEVIRVQHEGTYEGRVACCFTSTSPEMISYDDDDDDDDDSDINKERYENNR